jgi:hypothetical protein
MKEILKTINGLNFEPIKVLTLIESDSDLMSILSDETPLEISLLKTMVMNGVLDKKITTYLNNIFNSLIITKNDYAEKYKLIDDVKGIERKRSNLPRRYGKEQILTDIIKSGGKRTELQLAMLKINKLKNIYVNLSSRCIKDYFNDNKVLEINDYRDIIAVVEIAEKKLKNILKKK